MSVGTERTREGPNSRVASGEHRARVSQQAQGPPERAPRHPPRLRLGPGFAAYGEVRERQCAVVSVSRGKRASTTTRTPLAPSTCSWQTTTSRPTIGHHRHPPRAARASRALRLLPPGAAWAPSPNLCANRSKRRRQRDASCGTQAVGHKLASCGCVVADQL